MGALLLSRKGTLDMTTPVIATDRCASCSLTPWYYVEGGRPTVDIEPGMYDLSYILSLYADYASGAAEDTGQPHNRACSRAR